MSHNFNLFLHLHRSGGSKRCSSRHARTRLVGALLSLGCLAGSSSAHAQAYLVGAYLFAADGSGATTTPQATYQYDTNSAEAASPLQINGQGKGIAFALSGGDNNFTMSQSAALISDYGGTAGELGLYFDTTNSSYNSATPRTPDLLIARLTDGSTAFITPSAGTAINSYYYTSFGNSITSNGATSVQVGSTTITVSAFSVNNDTSGSFTLTSSSTNSGPTPATPEPGSVALLSGLAVSSSVFMLRRRRKA